MKFDPDAVREIERAALDLRALTAEQANPADEVRELEVRHFVAELDADEEGMERAIRELAALRDRYRVEGLFNEVFSAALSEQNAALARVALDGLRLLARQKLDRLAGDSSDEEGEEG